MRLRLVLDDTDITRFNRWMDEEISVVELAARVEQATDGYPYVLGGWNYLGDFKSHFQFCTFDDEDAYLAALADRANNTVEIDGKTAWNPQIKRNAGIHAMPPLRECTIDVEGYRLSQVIIEFWMDDKTNFYSTLLDSMARSFIVVDGEEIDDEGNPLQPKDSSRPQIARQSGKPRAADQLKATVVHYAVTVTDADQDRAADLVGTTSRTYRKYRDSRWLLSEVEYKKATGKTPAMAWEAHSS